MALVMCCVDRQIKLKKYLISTINSSLRCHSDTFFFFVPTFIFPGSESRRAPDNDSERDVQARARAREIN